MNRIVAARIVAVASTAVLVMSDPLAAHAAPELHLFQKINYQGDSQVITTTGCTNVAPKMEDDISSLVESQQSSVTLWEHPNCAGASLVVHGESPDLGAFDDRTMSVLVPK